MEITSAQVKALRDATGAGMMDSKRAGRSAGEGVIEAYLHTPDPNLPAKLGVLVELDCETDFVAKTDEFRRLARDIALHIAWSDPAYIMREDVPSEVVDRERAIYANQAEGKPAQVVERIVEGKLKDFYKQVVLLDQPFVRDQSQTVQELLDAYSTKVREKLVLRRVCRCKVGEAQ